MHPSIFCKLKSATPTPTISHDQKPQITFLYAILSLFCIPHCLFHTQGTETGTKCHKPVEDQEGEFALRECPRALMIVWELHALLPDLQTEDPCSLLQTPIEIKQIKLWFKFHNLFSSAHSITHFLSI